MKQVPGEVRILAAIFLWAAAGALSPGGAAPSLAQGYQLHFDRLSIDEGLSQVSANAVLQDSRGFMWIGTQDGLNRFDGYEVFVYKRDPADPESLPGNFILSLYEDRRHRLWIVTQPGDLTRLDLEIGRFRRFLHDPDDPASRSPGNVNPTVFYEDAAGRLWISVPGLGIDRIAADGAVTHVRPDPGDPESLPGAVVTAILEDVSGTVWIGLDGDGLARRLPPGEDGRERFVAYRHDPGDPESLGHDRVSVLYEDRAGRLLVGTRGAGLYQFDREREVFSRLPHPAAPDDGAAPSNTIAPSGSPQLPSILEDRAGNLWARTFFGLLRWGPDRTAVRHDRNDPDDPGSLSDNAVSSIYEDSAGALWVGTIQGGGLNRYQPERDGFRSFQRDPTDPRSLSSNLVQSLYEDRSGVLWIGTNNGGVSRFSHQKHQFRHYRRPASAPRGETDNMVFGLLVDRRGKLWAATLESGVYRYDDSRQDVVERYFADPGSPRDIGSSFVRVLYEDRRGRIWVGTQGGGLAAIDADAGAVAGTWTNDPNDEGTISNNAVFGIHEDGEGVLWLATGAGWNRFDPEAGSFERYFNDPEDPESLFSSNLRLTYEDRSGDLWVGGTGGFARFDRERGTFINFVHDPADRASLASPNVMALWDDGEGHMWVATYGGGLARLDLSTGGLRHFTRNDGLPSASLYSLVPDGSGRVWISTNHGISRFDPRTETFTNYDKDDGLQSNEFNGGAYFATPEGELLFGGVNGITSFFPEEIRPRTYEPPVVLTAFKKFDQVESFGVAFDRTERIVLSHRDNFFGFEFAALDYDSPTKNRYAYKLEGFDREWVESGSRRYATYTNLDGGTYTFHVRGSNSDGVWSDDTASIEVVVVPPPWRTWWAYGLYAAAAAASMAGYLRFKTRRYEAEMRLQREELERQRLLAERLRQIDTMKDEFLANTSHELRTPLNGIIGIAESLLDGATGEIGPATRQNLFMVASSGRRLAHLVDDILDFSKLKNREIELNLRAVSLRELVEIVLTLSRPLLAGKDVVLENRVQADLPAVAADENRLQQILHNLVGNAIKFTDEGAVTVRAEAKDGVVATTVADTGIGIPADKLGRIFDSFEQADASTARRYGGTGLGLTISRQLTELHGGEIRVESEVGKGSAFTFTLSVAGDEVEAPPSDASRQLTRMRDRLAEAPDPAPGLAKTAFPEGIESADGNGNRELEVLVVDDEPINLQVMRNILTLRHYQVTQAQDGREALGLLEGGYVPDLVLLDVMMPRMTGFEVARRVRERYSANDLPIILVTAKNQVSDLMEGLASGANDYITKPFSKDELLARIRTHVSLSKAHSAEAENQRRTRELEQARAIQLSMLPAEAPNVPFLEIATYMKTATEVGGDYYDFFPQADGSVYLATGDATGHGIPAGMMVSMTKSALRALDVQSPHVLLAQLNRVFREVHLQRMKMALNVAYVTSSEVALASAAMPPVYFYRAAAGEVTEVLVSGLPLGSLPDLAYRLEVLDFRSGDVLVLVSDGLPELLNAEERPLGYEALERCLAERAEETAEEILRALVELGERWAGSDGALEDDVTVIVVKRR